MQHHSDSMLLPFENIVLQSKYQELFSKSFEEVSKNYTNITNYTEPYSIIRRLNQKIFSLIKNEDREISISFKLATSIGKISDVPHMDILEELQKFSELIQDKIKERSEIKESKFDDLLYTGLLKLSFFEPLMKGLFRKYQLDEQYFEQLFSSARRPWPQSCDCDWGEQGEKDPESCSSCSAHTAFFSHSSIILHRNFSEHANQLLLSNNRKALEESFKNSQFIWSKIKTSDMIKIAATIYHLLGFNDLLWDKASYTVEDIWENYPSTVSVDEMSETLNRLMSGRIWKDYVDLKGRKANLITELKNGKVITIYGEGATGKTELVYQSLDDIVNSGDFSFDYLLPFTFKGNQQGELNDEGELTEVNHQGWDAKSEFTQILDVLSSKCTIPIRDGTDSDERFQRAADFLATQKVCMIIDNHETVDANDPDRSFDRLLKEFTEHPDFSSSHTRIILTTRVKPDEKRIGKSIKMKYLSFEEMSKLSRLRSRWLAANNRNQNFNLQLQDENDKHWEDLQIWLTNELNHQLERELAGHPRVVFIAVYAAMFKNEQKKPLKEIIKNLIQEARNISNSEHSLNPLRSLMTYITSRSFTYIPDIDSNYPVIAKLARLHEFSDQELIVICSEVEGHYSKLQQDLINLNLIVETETGYSFRTRYHSQDLLEFINERYGPMKDEGESFKWWSSKLQDITLRPIPWNKLQHLTINNLDKPLESALESAATTIRDNILRLESKEVIKENFDRVIALVRQLKKCLVQMNRPQETHQILSDKDSRAYLPNFERFCLLSINSAIKGLSKIPESTLPLNEFNGLTNLSHEMCMAFQEKTENTTFWDEIEEHIHVLLNALCYNSRKYSNDTSASLHTLWNLSQFYLEEHPSYAICIGNKLLNHAGRNTDKDIINTILNLDILPEENDMEPLIKLLKPFGEYLWHDSETSLDSPEIKNFLEQLLELKSDGVFSKLETSVSDIGVSKKILSGTITDTEDTKISIRGIAEFEFEQAEVVVQVLATVYESDGEEGVEHLLCRLLNIKGVKEIPVKPSTLPLPTNQNSGNVQTTTHRSLNEISRDEMWDLLSSYHFTTIQASQLLGPILRNIAKENSLPTGTWKKWKKKNFREYPNDFSRIIKEISNDSWSVREKRTGEWWISRGSHKLSKNEEQSLKEFIERQNNKRLEIISFGISNVSKKPKKRRIIGHINPLRGRPRSSNPLEEEE